MLRIMHKKLLVVLAIIIIWFSLPHTVLAQVTPQAPGRVIIYMIDKLTLEDLDPAITPNLWQMQKEGGLGLLNTLSAGEKTSKNVACTLSAGKLAVGSTNANLNYKCGEIINNEKAGDIFFRNTGIKPAEENIIVSSIAVINKNNQKRNLGQPGLLGDELHKLGLKTVLIGNADFFDYKSRIGALILMDSRGIIDNGSVGNDMVNLSTSFLPTSDYNRILEAFKEYASYQVILVEFGDLVRLESVSQFYSPEKFIQERKIRLREIDTCIGNLQQQVIANDTVYVISPTPSQDALQRGELLTPIIMSQPEGEGFLTSYSTRRLGVVSSLSFKNSVLHNFNPAQTDTIHYQPATGVYDTLVQLNQRLMFEYSNQAFIVTFSIALLVLILILAMITRIKKSLPIISTDILLLFATAIPLSLLLIANFDVFDRWYYLLLLLTINISICLICLFSSRLFKVSPLIMVFILTIITISLDLILNLGMLSQSLLSYRITSGSRYYGLGNEYMGVLIGSAIAFTTLILHQNFSRFNLLITALLFMFIILLIADPMIGINVGGSITASLGLSYTYMRYQKQNIKFYQVLCMILLTILLVSIMAVIDLNRPLEYQSHLGHSINLLLSGGISEIVNIISRKVQMQFSIINYSVWGWILLLLTVIASYFVFRPSRLLIRVREQLPIIYCGLQGIIIAAIIAIIFNDSGITAAAVLSLYFVTICTKYLPS